MVPMLSVMLNLSVFFPPLILRPSKKVFGLILAVRAMDCQALHGLKEIICNSGSLIKNGG
jgi:hypothetical protein